MASDPGYLAATRDASSIHRPDVRTAKVFHVAPLLGGATVGRAADTPHLEAACSRAVLDENGAVPLSQVPSRLQCRRPACRKVFAGSLLGESVDLAEGVTP